MTCNLNICTSDIFFCQKWELVTHSLQLAAWKCEYSLNLYELTTVPRKVTCPLIALQHLKPWTCWICCYLWLAVSLSRIYSPPLALLLFHLDVFVRHWGIEFSLQAAALGLLGGGSGKLLIIVLIYGHLHIAFHPLKGQLLWYFLWQ